MNYKSIPFTVFGEEYIGKPHGYLSVYFNFLNPKEDSNYEESKEPEEVKPTRLILRMDMVYPPRLDDGKVRFLEVQISTKKEYEQAVKYLRETQELLKKSLDDNFKSGEETLIEVDLS